MNSEEEPVPSDDAIAERMRAALARTVTEQPVGAIEWTDVLSRARRTAFVRRVVATGTCVVVVLGATAVAVAATSGNRDRGGSVVATGDSSTTTSTESPSSTRAIDTTTVPTAPSSTSPTATNPPPPNPTSTSTPVAQDARAATPGDFTGVFEHWREICDPCVRGEFDKGITLTIRNNTDHPIDLSTAAPVRVAVVCSVDMTPDGRLTQPLPSWPTDIFADSVSAGGDYPSAAYASPGSSLAPGAEATNSGATGFVFEGLGLGTATCEGAIVASSDGTWRPDTLSVVAPLTGFPTYSFEIIDPPTSTTTATSANAPS